MRDPGGPWPARIAHVGAMSYDVAGSAAMSAHRPDSRGDGDGWVECAQGHRHWGRHGAAGLLLHRSGPGGPAVLLQHRAEWSHHGGTWGLLGGARQSTETVEVAALREAHEEGAVEPSGVRVDARSLDDHGGWSYTTVLARPLGPLSAAPSGAESIDVAWVPLARVTQLPLHPGFAASWPALQTALGPLTVVVDTANVMGSRPDGWWRDRAGAARRIVAGCARLADRGIASPDLPDGVAPAGPAHWWPQLVVVVEGAARPAVDAAGLDVDVVAAPRSGDDEIVDRATAATALGPVVVVTADRELRRRCAAVGARSVGPRWLTARLDAVG